MTSFPIRVASALARLDALEDPSARTAAHDALAAVLEFHGEGLRRTFTLLHEGSGDHERLIEKLSHDEVVSSLLVLHGLHPQTVETRVRGALGGIVTSAHDRIEIVSVDPSSVQVRVAGSERLRREVARAVADAVPDVAHVEVVPTDRGLVPIERLTAKQSRDHERCDLCGQSLVTGHEHLFDVDTRRLRCSCVACSILFDAPKAKTRRVRRVAARLDGFRLDDAQWRALTVPVGLAFLSSSSTRSEVIASYPGPAGVMEAVVSRAAWEALVTANPTLAEMEPDTQALLIHRLSAVPIYHIVSIDECFRLTAIIRERWQGMTGGTGPLRAIEEFLRGLGAGGS